MKLCVKFEHNGTTYVTLPNVPEVKKLEFCGSAGARAEVMNGTAVTDFMSMPFIENPKVTDTGERNKLYVSGYCNFNGVTYYMDTKINGLEASTEGPEIEQEDELELEPVIEQEVEAKSEEPELEVEQEVEPEIESEVEPEIEPEVATTEPEVKIEENTTMINETPTLVPNNQPTPIKFVFGRKGRAGVRLQSTLSHYETKQPVITPPPAPVPVKVEKHSEDIDDTVTIEEVEVKTSISPETEAKILEASAKEVEVEEEPEVLYEDNAEEEEENGYPSWVLELSKNFLKNSKAYTSNLVDKDELRNKGLPYCKKNRWHINDDVAQIDEVKTKLRYIYNDTYEEFVVLTRDQIKELLH